MYWISARFRIAAGLLLVSVSVLMVAMVLGLVPDRRGAILEGRARLCEAIAINASLLVNQDDINCLRLSLESTAKRNDDILSAAVRNANGRLVVDVGDHTTHWTMDGTTLSTDTHVQVPIRSGNEKWGSVELAFRPVQNAGTWGFPLGPWARLIGFVASSSFLLFFVFLNKSLQHLDPSQTVPKRVRTTLNTFAEGLFFTDLKGRIVLANQVFASWLGTTSEQLMGRRVDSLPWQKPDDVPEDEPFPWTYALESGLPRIGEMLRLDHEESRNRTLLVNCSPVLGNDSKHRGVLATFEDITQLEENKVQLSKARDLAEEANRAKSEFLARMSHEIRTPMNAILGYTDVLRRGFDDSETDRQEYLDTIHASGEHLMALINDILDLSKIESGRMELELARCSPHQLISQVIAVLRVRANEKGITLTFESEGGLPETILTDAVRLRQVIMNLVGNAIKFTNDGGVKIVARLERDDEKQLFAIDVIDSGIGISEEAAKKIFDPFAQADTSITRRFGGTGLGLAISRQLTEAMSGDVTVKSTLGEGSVFTVTIDPGPLDGIRIIDAETADVEVKQLAEQKPAQNKLPPARILVVDDGESNRKLMSLVLSRAGVTVETAENGRQGVDLALEKPFDVILMDMQMPIMDGYTAATLLRENGYTLPIIALTAHAMHGHEDRCRSAGCSGFLSKPINMDKLISTLATILGDLPADELIGDLQVTASAFGERGTEPEQPDLDRQIDQVEYAVDQAIQLEECDLDPEEDLPLSSPASVTDQHRKVVSSLPMDDDEFREIVEEFVDRLREKLGEMDLAWAKKDLAELARLAHWLKGSGGTAGFGDFTHPAQELEDRVKLAQMDRIDASITELNALANAIFVPAGETVNSTS